MKAVAALFFVLTLAAGAIAQPDIVPRDPLGWDAEKQGEFVHALCTDRRGDLWAGTEDNGLWRRNATGIWTHFSVENGLGDDTVLALKTDTLGRVWAGHSRRGVSVWNGARWGNYDQLTGPLSERVSAIAIHPRDGSVWMATDNGLARYGEGEGWRYFTSQQGLVPAQIVALAFNGDGDVFAASACDGLWIGRAVSGYLKWQQVQGPEVQPATPIGSGLPSNLLNDVAVDAEGDIWVATVYGIARSTDNGESWYFLRGKDWLANVEGSAAALKAKPAKVGVDLLAEDWVTSLAVTPKGQVWLGFREKGFERREGGTAELVFTTADDFGSIPDFSLANNGDYVRALCPLGEAGAVVGRYGGNVRQTNGGMKMNPPWPSGLAPQTNPPLPAPARAPEPAVLQAMQQQIKDMTSEMPVGGGAFVGTDWNTRGDWVGRYGDRYARLYAAEASSARELVHEPGTYAVRADIGPHQTTGGPYTYVHWMQSDNPNVLYVPTLGVRRQGEINDGAWDHTAYPFSWEGPDLWFNISVGEGLSRVSLYAFNKDGHGGLNRYRDYSFHLKPGAEDPAAAGAAPDLAHGRLMHTWNGGYAQFLVRGPAHYQLKMARDRSFGAVLSGLFIDRAAGPPTDADSLPMSWLGGTRYVAEPVSVPDGGATPAIAPAISLWSALDVAAAGGRALPFLKTGRLLAYRAALAGGAPANLLYNWRWTLDLWEVSDRDEFKKVMAVSYQKFQGEREKTKLANALAEMAARAAN